MCIVICGSLLDATVIGAIGAEGPSFPLVISFSVRWTFLVGVFFSDLVFFAGLCADPDVDLISPLFNSVKRDVALFAALSPSFAVALNYSFTLDLSKSLSGNSSSNSGGYYSIEHCFTRFAICRICPPKVCQIGRMTVIV